MDFRHEHKHYINYADYIVIKSRLQQIMELDRHTGEDGEYKIRSIYFENYQDKALNEKLDGVNEREKFRIRYYKDDFSYITLEKKSKMNGLSNKRAVTITKEEVEAIIQGDIEWMSKSKIALFVELYSKMKSQMLRPRTIVDYIREPYVFIPGNVRVTIDKDIRTGIMNMDIFNTELTTVPVGENIMLLEVKYDNFLPEIIADIIQLGDRKKTAFSKYASCRIYG
ncbi:MAG TPA: polyphosphate polymerase domain-containing protein [Mobilitalea sp.]|nr:polyphosphate polymerase domain-containing protein [Mobilitalea sp.]